MDMREYAKAMQKYADTIGKPAAGAALDRIGEIYALPRKKYLWFLKESDIKYRKRLREKLVK